MDSSSLQLHQEIMDSQSLDSMLMCTKSESDQQQQQQQEKKPRPADEQALKCPRCDSSNTKFCYYNNYSLTQPRYFCKSCRRYWTKGGTLRNVPVGGGCRKNKRCSSASRRSNTPDHLHSLITSPTSSSQHLISPLTSYDHHHNNNNAHDLTLAFAHHHQNGNIPILGNSGNSHFDLFGNHFTGNLLDSLRSGLVHHDHNNNNNNNNINNGLHLYYGGNLENVENGGGNVVNDLSHEDHHQHQQMGMHFDLLHHQNHNHHQQDIMSNGSSGASTPTIKQELGDHNGPSSVLLNYIMNGGGGDQMDHHHAPRESWNTGVLGSSWHNLLHSPLM